MSHIKYTTPAFLLYASSSGEADKVLHLYTKEFGKIAALGKSVRLLRSKLKNALEVGNLVSASLVRGKEIWRLTDATIIEKLNFPSAEINLFLKILKLLKKLVQGEEQNERLFESLLQIFEALMGGGIPEEFLESLECVALVKMLDALGYGREETDWGISTNEPITLTLLRDVLPNRKKLISLINKSLNESHL